MLSSLIKNCAIILSAYTIVFAQNSTLIDSLTKKLDYVDGTQKASTLVDLSYAYWGSAPSKSMQYAKEALVFSKKINDLKNESSALNCIGNVFWAQTEYDSALVYYFKALDLRKKNKDTLGVAGAQHNIGMVYSSKGKYFYALQNYQESLNYYKLIKDSSGVAKACNSIGALLWSIRDYKNAIKYFNESLKIKRSLGDSTGVAVVLNNIGLIYKRLGNYVKAFNALKRSLEIKEKFNNKLSIETAYLNLGSILYSQNKYKSSREYLSKALKIANDISDNEVIIKANCNILEIELKQNNLSEAKKRIDECLKLTKRINSIPISIVYYKSAANYFSVEGDYKTALNYSLKLNKLKDSLFSKQLDERIAELEVKYKAKQKDTEIDLLKNEKKIQALKLENEKNFRNFLLIASALFVLLSVSLLYAYSTKEKLNKELQNINASKDKFFSIISHDLKNPFNSIISFSKMLINDYDKLSESERKTSLLEINKSANKSSELLDNLLSWSLSQRRLIPVVPEKINLKILVEEAINLLITSAENKNITIKNFISEDIFAFADKNTTSSVLRNLISNAVKFTKKGGIVTIKAEIINTYIQIEISDSGIGIPKDKMDSLFNLETTSSVDGTYGEKGTGVGLILCSEFIKKNGGKIWAESKVGIGSSFKFTLPRTK